MTRSTLKRSTPKHPVSGAAGLVVPSLVIVCLVALSLVLAGCGGSSTPTPSSTVTVTAKPSGTPTSTVKPTTSPTSGTTETMVTAPYLLKGEKITPVHREVSKSLGVAAAAMNALLQAPTDAEKAAGLSTTIPPGTKLLALKIVNGIATVDLSKEFESGGGTLSMTARLAQVVFTLTQFSSIDAVTFMIDHKKVSTFGGEGIMIGTPQTRADYEELSPAILIEWPAVGDTSKSPLVVKGTANVFEAVFQVQILDSAGKIIVKKTVSASAGTGTRGTFSAVVPFSTSSATGTLKAFSLSPKDGKPENVVTVPLTFAK